MVVSLFIKFLLQNEVFVIFLQNVGVYVKLLLQKFEYSVKSLFKMGVFC
jgi:hypothetical protein